MARWLPSRPMLLAVSALALTAPTSAGAGPYGVVKFGGYLPTAGDFPGQSAGFAFEMAGGLPVGPVLALELGAEAYSSEVDVWNGFGSKYRAALYGLMVPLSLQLGAPIGEGVEPYVEGGVDWHYVELDALSQDSDSSLGYHLGAGLYVRSFLVSIRWFQAKVDLLNAKQWGIDGVLLTLGIRLGEPHPARPRR